MSYICLSLSLQPFVPQQLREPTVSANGSLGATTRIRCNGNTYGIRLNLKDCKQAFDKIDRSGKEIMFAQRRAPAGSSHMSVPYRFVSDNDGCIIEVGLEAGTEADSASFVQIAQAASAVMGECVRLKDGIGGIAWNLAPSGLFQACSKLLETIRTNTTKSVFGTKGLPGVEYYLRFLAFYNGPPTTCALAIDPDNWTPEFRDTESWYNIWDQATSMLVACIKHGKLPKGRAALGESLNML
ncbi:MAG: hypothetical protein Q9219_003943 [cf. Caloplaca sp. 3 TL-2023]